MSEALTHGDGQDFLDAWKQAWEARDVDAFLGLFREDADMRPDPFAEPLLGELAIRAYWNRFAADHVNTELDAERLWVQGHTILAAWHGASTIRRTAERVRHRGFVVFDLDDERRILRLRGYPQERVVGLDSTVRPEGPSVPAQEGA